MRKENSIKKTNSVLSEEQKAKKAKTRKIVTCIGLGVGAVVFAGLTAKVISLGNENSQLRVDNSSLFERNTILYADNKNLANMYSKTKKDLSDSIIRHNLKDEAMKTIVSDGLRHGSPKAAQAMSDLRWAYSNGDMIKTNVS